MFGHQTMFDGVWSPNISRLGLASGLRGLGSNPGPGSGHCDE